jgi:hypothetical protein
MVSTLSAEEQKEFADAIKIVSKYVQQMLNGSKKENFTQT